MRSGQANSKMFPKESRPPYLQDDDYFDSFKQEIALQAVMAWGQTMAVQKSNTLKENKAEKTNNMRRNTMVKLVEVKAGQDDATSVFHPQRFMRPPVVAVEKYWSLFPKVWEEKYYSVYLEDVGLQHDLGQKQIELLHDRRSSIKVKMFAPCNVNVGREGTRTTNIKNCEDGSADLVSKDEWTKLASLSDLELALDNLVAAWAVFWPGDHSMVTLRRVVSKTKSFKAVGNETTRMKLLEVFINQILEVNQRKAMQDEVPMTFKEVMEVAKDKLNVHDYFPATASNNFATGGRSGNGGKVWNKTSGGRAGPRNDNTSELKERMKRMVKDHKINGREICLDYNKTEFGEVGCKDRLCKKAHACAWVDRGQTKPCGGKHSKGEHFSSKK